MCGLQLCFGTFEIDYRCSIDSFVYMMVAMEEVRPTLDPNFEQLEEEFESLQGYVRGTG